MIKASFKNFMAGLIDYAGLFPPARLGIETASGNYARYLEGEDGWMLGRYIVPAAQLSRLAACSGFRCSVIVSPDVSQEELDQLSTFQARVEMVETHFADAAGSPDQVLDQLLNMKDRLGQAGLRGVRLFVEAGRILPAAAAIAAFNSRGSGGEVIGNVGCKLRCGGMEKRAFPTPERVAEFIGICRDHDIPMKFTAGMHNPLPNISTETGVMQHGFINVFGAALLSWGCNISIDEAARCVREETAQHFHFTEESFSWQDKTISSGEIKRLRGSRVISFGSCSFTEPVEGLRSLGFTGKAGAKL